MYSNLRTRWWIVSFTIPIEKTRWRVRTGYREESLSSRRQSNPDSRVIQPVAKWQLTDPGKVDEWYAKDIICTAPRYVVFSRNGNGFLRYKPPRLPPPKRTFRMRTPMKRINFKVTIIFLFRCRRLGSLATADAELILKLEAFHRVHMDRSSSHCKASTRRIHSGLWALRLTL
jgi:hypothetical protein